VVYYIGHGERLTSASFIPTRYKTRGVRITLRYPVENTLGSEAQSFSLSSRVTECLR
jgi:hypothetical protein